LQLSHPHLLASSETPKPHERKSFELSKKIWRGYPCLRAALETMLEMGFLGWSGLGTGTRFVREFMAKIRTGAEQ
jgi:hypothetical protein